MHLSLSPSLSLSWQIFIHLYCQSVRWTALCLCVCDMSCFSSFTQGNWCRMRVGGGARRYKVLQPNLHIQHMCTEPSDYRTTNWSCWDQSGSQRGRCVCLGRGCMCVGARGDGLLTLNKVNKGTINLIRSNLKYTSQSKGCQGFRIPQYFRNSNLRKKKCRKAAFDVEVSCHILKHTRSC